MPFSHCHSPVLKNTNIDVFTHSSYHFHPSRNLRQRHDLHIIYYIIIPPVFQGGVCRFFSDRYFLNTDIGCYLYFRHSQNFLYKLYQ